MKSVNGFEQELPLDAWFILIVLEPLTQKIQKWIGLDCFFWAWIAIPISAVMAAISALAFWFSVYLSASKGNLVLLTHSFVLAGVYGTFLFYDYHVMRCPHCGVSATRRLAYEELSVRRRNPRIFFFRFRYILALVTIFAAVLDPFEGESVAFYLAYAVIKTPIFLGYAGHALIACTPLPPQKSKLRQGLEWIRDVLNAINNEEPLAEPS